MIPDLPEGIEPDKVLEFYDHIAANLSDQSTIHVNWFTHRRNPSVCWFCDQTILITKLIALCDSFITKSTIDIETASMSEDVTDTESEIDSEVNQDYYTGEAVPEYETVDEEE